MSRSDGEFAGRRASVIFNGDGCNLYPFFSVNVFKIVENIRNILLNKYLGTLLLCLFETINKIHIDLFKFQMYTICISFMQ